MMSKWILEGWNKQGFSTFQYHFRSPIPFWLMKWIVRSIIIEPSNLIDTKHITVSIVKQGFQKEIDLFKSKH